MSKLVSLVSIVCLAFAFTACGDEISAVEIQATVENWTDGKQDVVAFGLPEVTGTVSANGTLRVTLPATLPGNALTDLPRALDLKNYGLGCSEGVNVSNSSAKGVAFYAMSYKESISDPGLDPEMWYEDDVVIVPEPDVDRPMLFQLYSTVDTKVTGTCSKNVEVEIYPGGIFGEEARVVTYNLELDAGWNVVRLNGTWKCLEGDDLSCDKAESVGTIESTDEAFNDVPWSKTMYTNWYSGPCEDDSDCTRPETICEAGGYCASQ